MSERMFQQPKRQESEKIVFDHTKVNFAFGFLENKLSELRSLEEKTNQTEKEIEKIEGKIGSLGDIIDRIANLKKQKKGKQESGMEMEAKKARDIIGEELLGEIEEALNDKLSQEKAAADGESVNIEHTKYEETGKEIMENEIAEQVEQVETFFELKRILGKNWDEFKNRIKKEHFNQMLTSKSAKEFIESGIVNYFPSYVIEKTDDLANPEKAEGLTVLEGLFAEKGKGEAPEIVKPKPEEEISEEELKNLMGNLKGIALICETLESGNYKPERKNDITGKIEDHVKAAINSSGSVESLQNIIDNSDMGGDEKEYAKKAIEEYGVKLDVSGEGAVEPELKEKIAGMESLLGRLENEDFESLSVDELEKIKYEIDKYFGKANISGIEDVDLKKSMTEKVNKLKDYFDEIKKELDERVKKLEIKQETIETLEDEKGREEMEQKLATANKVIALYKKRGRLINVNLKEIKESKISEEDKKLEYQKIGEWLNQTNKDIKNLYEELGDIEKLKGVLVVEDEYNKIKQIGADIDAKKMDWVENIEEQEPATLEISEEEENGMYELNDQQFEEVALLLGAGGEGRWDSALFTLRYFSPVADKFEFLPKDDVSYLVHSKDNKSATIEYMKKGVEFASVNIVFNHEKKSIGVDVFIEEQPAETEAKPTEETPEPKVERREAPESLRESLREIEKTRDDLIAKLKEENKNIKEKVMRGEEPSEEEIAERNRTLFWAKSFSLDVQFTKVAIAGYSEPEEERKQVESAAKAQEVILESFKEIIFASVEKAEKSSDKKLKSESPEVQGGVGNFAGAAKKNIAARMKELIFGSKKTKETKGTLLERTSKEKLGEIGKAESLDDLAKVVEKIIAEKKRLKLKNNTVNLFDYFKKKFLNKESRYPDLEREESLKNWIDNFDDIEDAGDNFKKWTNGVSEEMKGVARELLNRAREIQKMDKGGFEGGGDKMRGEGLKEIKEMISEEKHDIDKVKNEKDLVELLVSLMNYTSRIPRPAGFGAIDYGLYNYLRLEKDDYADYPVLLAKMKNSAEAIESQELKEYYKKLIDKIEEIENERNSETETPATDGGGGMEGGGEEEGEVSDEEFMNIFLKEDELNLDKVKSPDGLKSLLDFLREEIRGLEISDELKYKSGLQEVEWKIEKDHFMWYFETKEGDPEIIKNAFIEDKKLAERFESESLKKYYLEILDKVKELCGSENLEDKNLRVETSVIGNSSEVENGEIGEANKRKEEILKSFLGSFSKKNLEKIRETIESNKDNFGFFLEIKLSQLEDYSPGSYKEYIKEKMDEIKKDISDEEVKTLENATLGDVKEVLKNM